MRKLFVLFILAGLGGAGLWAATQPSGLPAVQASSDAAFTAKTRVAAAFARGAALAFVTRKAQSMRVHLSDEELTSLAAENVSGGVTNPVVHGTGSGLFQVGGDDAVQGVTLHFSAGLGVNIDSRGNLHLAIQSANVGSLPLPGGLVQSLADSASSASIPLPPGIGDLVLQPVDGGAVLTGTATPV